MKKKIVAMVALVVALGLGLCACTQQEPEPTPEPPAEKTQDVQQEPSPSSTADYFGALHVSEGSLLGEDGAPAQLRGISSHGLSWFPEYVNDAALEQMRAEWDCNVFRLAMYTAEYNGYCVGDEANREQLRALIDSAVQKTEELEMYVIIDWHTLTDNNPLHYQDEAVAFFGEMAQKYADKEHVIFEICNEPNGSTTWEEVKAYAEAVIPVIREYSDAVILVGTPTWSQDIHLAAANPLQGENIMYTLHFYAATHKDDLRQRMTEAIDAGVPVFVSEYGICDASGNGAIDEEQADTWLELMNEKNVSHVMWNLSNKDESSAMISSDVSKTGDFTQEDLSQAGLWFVSRIAGDERLSEGAASGAQKSSANEKSSTLSKDNLRVGLKNEWDAGSQKAYQYEASLKNTLPQDAKSWTVEIVFNQAIQLQEGWNGSYEVSGNVLVITPAAYNVAIATGDTAGDIGFILEAQTGLAIEDAVVTMI